MKLVIPSQCQIGTRTYKIVWWNEKYSRAADSVAQSDTKYQVIRLSRVWSDIANFVHLIHEARHSVNYLLSDRDDGENHIRAESELIAQMVLSLGIEPDFSQIQEEEL